MVLSGITIISKGKALKKEKESWKKRRLLLIMVMSEQTCPLQKVTSASGKTERLLFWKQSLNSKTYYLESCTNTGRLITFQFFPMPLGTTNTGLDPQSTSHFSNCGRRTRRQWALGSLLWLMNDAYDAWYVRMQMQKWPFFVTKGFFRQIRILCKHYGTNKLFKASCFDTLSQGNRLLKRKLNKQHPQ